MKKTIALSTVLAGSLLLCTQSVFAENKSSATTEGTISEQNQMPQILKTLFQFLLLIQMIPIRRLHLTNQIREHPDY